MEFLINQLGDNMPRVAETSLTRLILLVNLYTDALKKYVSTPGLGQQFRPCRQSLLTPGCGRNEW